MSEKAYFDAPLPHVLAHRGFHTNCPENTLAAFEAALALGATHIETDAHVSADGLAVLVHDPVLTVDGQSIVVSERTAEQLAALDLGGGHGVPLLALALSRFPEARFNIDVKVAGVAQAVVDAVTDAQAQHRVLIASFRARRRKAAVKPLGSVTSPSALQSLAIVVLASCGFTWLGSRILRTVDAVQLPTKVMGIEVFTPRFIQMCHRAKVFVHAWTINDPAQMRALLNRGIDGIVTDRCDLAVEVLKSF
ncbi:MAG: hypothetical protein RLZZ600_749 [Actinomycetota bacterium]|jgi:glycerophosphoryl diester phosphodiesterase